MKQSAVKERIIETASQLFYAEGYNQTGINQIIAEASVAKASMYQHFRSKEDIAVAYLRRRHFWWMGQLSDFVATKKSVKQKVIASFDFLDHWLSDVGYRGCGFQNIITDLPKDHSKIKSEVLFHKNELREWIYNLLQQESQYADKKARQISDEVLVLIEGAIILSQIQKDAWPIVTAKSACKKLLTG